MCAAVLFNFCCTSLACLTPFGHLILYVFPFFVKKLWSKDTCCNDISDLFCVLGLSMIRIQIFARRSDLLPCLFTASGKWMVPQWKVMSFSSVSLPPTSPPPPPPYHVHVIVSLSRCSFHSAFFLTYLSHVLYYFRPQAHQVFSPDVESVPSCWRSISLWTRHRWLSGTM